MKINRTRRTSAKRISGIESSVQGRARMSERTKLGKADSSKPKTRAQNKSRERLSGKALMALPASVRHRMFAEQAKKAAKYYAIDPDLDFRADGPILEP